MILRLRGCHATVVILTAAGEDLSSSLGCLHKCLRKLLWSTQSCKGGLSNTYVAVIAEPDVHQCLNHKLGTRSVFGKWYFLSCSTPQHELSSPKSADFTFLESVVAALESAVETKHNSDHTTSPTYWNEQTNQIHALLDKAPWKPSEYAVVDVCWLLPGNTAVSASASLGLYGALLRLKEWHNASIQIVTSGKAQVGEWQAILDSPPVSDGLSTSSGVIWRGSLYFTGHKVLKQGHTHSVAFPGFALALSSVPEISASGDLLKAIGMTGGHPSHLEVVQGVDMDTLPLFWRSPVHCTFSLVNITFQDSVALFQHLFTRTSSKPLGLIVRLCLTDCGPLQQAMTTADWINYIQAKDEGSTLTAPSLLLPGPLLLLYPADQSEHCNWSCDAWFLWKPESIRTQLFIKLREQMVIRDDRLDQVTDMQQQLLQQTKSDPPGVGDFWSHLSHFTHELDTSAWPEIEALQTHEWIQRKMIRRLATPDLMFGQMVAPPPTSTKKTTDITDVLDSFTDSGRPAASQLSPIAMREPSNAVRMHCPEAGGISYQAIVQNTPSSKKHFHGVSYCLTAEDTSMDARLSKIQQRYLTSERDSNCIYSNPPMGHSRKQKATQDPIHEEKGGKLDSPEPEPSMKKRRPIPRHPLKSPVVKLSRVSAEKLGMTVKKRGSNKASQIASGKRSLDVVAQRAACSSPPADPTKGLRRSPRRNKWQSKKEAHTEAQQESGAQRTGKGSSGRGSGSHKEKSLKKQLEDVVVAVLKKNIPRDHMCFRKCYIRLFNLSKSFLKDLKASKNLAVEMERVVQFNATQVVEFELRQADMQRQ